MAQSNWFFLQNVPSDNDDMILLDMLGDNDNDMLDTTFK